MNSTPSELMKIGGHTSLQSRTRGNYELEVNLVSSIIKNNKICIEVAGDKRTAMPSQILTWFQNVPVKVVVGSSGPEEVIGTEMPTSRLRGEVRGRAKRMSPLLFCTVSCLQINGVIQFPGRVTFSLGINCDHPNKYRKITLKTYIYEAHSFKTFSNSEIYLCLSKSRKKKTSIQDFVHLCISLSAAG